MLIRKLFKAEMAHMVPGAYTSRCHHLHGHSYLFELFLESQKSNSASMVADFKGIKDMGINDFFDSFDHAVILWDQSPQAKIANQINPNRHIIVPFVPTAEMLAKACFVISQAILDTGPKLSGEQDVTVSHTIVHETATGYGSYRKEDMAKDEFPSIQFEKWIFSKGIQEDWKTPLWHKKALERLSPKLAAY